MDQTYKNPLDELTFVCDHDAAGRTKVFLQFLDIYATSVPVPNSEILGVDAADDALYDILGLNDQHPNASSMATTLRDEVSGDDVTYRRRDTDSIAFIYLPDEDRFTVYESSYYEIEEPTSDVADPNNNDVKTTWKVTERALDNEKIYLLDRQLMEDLLDVSQKYSYFANYLDIPTGYPLELFKEERIGLAEKVQEWDGSEIGEGKSGSVVFEELDDEDLGDDFEKF